jgi:glycine/D-amino acid oxidase-like deaminating enzyme
MDDLDDGEARLTAGESLWASLNPGRLPTMRPRPGALAEADIVIIGAGVTGAFLAERLTREGRSVIIVDRRAPTTGSTAASTAMLQWEIDAPLIELEDRLGFEAAQRICRQSIGAVQGICDLVSANAIPCAMKRRSSIYLAGDELDAGDMREEKRIRDRMGLAGDLLDAAGLTAMGFRGDAALVYPGSAEVDPVALTRGLLRKAQARDAVILSPAIAETYDETTDGVEVGLVGGAMVRAKLLVLANGYEMPDFVPAHAHRITSSWALATRPLHPDAFWAARALVWEAADPYLYFRSAPGGRIVAGGEDADIADADARDALIGAKTQAILAKLEARCPLLKGVKAEFAWAGFFGETTDSLPLIGRPPGRRHCFAAFGYGGNGITFSAIAADMLARDLAGERDPNADAYALDRSG